jgi:hypothetical protein
MTTGIQGALDLFEEFQERLPPDSVHRLQLKRMLDCVIREHGRAEVEMQANKLMRKANLTIADRMLRKEDDFSVGTSKTSKAKRVMVTLKWLTGELDHIARTGDLLAMCDRNQKIILVKGRLSNTTVPSHVTTTAADRNTSTREATLVFTPFLSSLPSQRVDVDWSLNAVEVNWNYDELALKYRFSEERNHDTRIPLIKDVLLSIAQCNWIKLTTHPERHTRPTEWTPVVDIGDCPIIIWLKPDESKKRPLPPHATAVSPPTPAFGSSSSWETSPWQTGSQWGQTQWQWPPR